jgi:hypothetical protein
MNNKYKNQSINQSIIHFFMKTYENWGGKLVTGKSVFGELEIGQKSRRISGMANRFSAYH